MLCWIWGVGAAAAALFLSLPPERGVWRREETTMGSSSLLSMMEARMPPGFRFHPRDDELVLNYLAKRIANSGCHMMIDVDLNKVEPWDLPDEACVGGKEWYFYSLRDRKYATGQRTNRATVSGYWKATGKDRHVVVDYSRRNGGGAASGGGNGGSTALVGMRKTLVFYKGRAPKGKKTDWVMHEFRMESAADTFRREDVDCTSTTFPTATATAITISSSNSKLSPLDCWMEQRFHPTSGALESLHHSMVQKWELQEDWVLCRVFFKSRTLTVKASAAGAAATATTGGDDNCYDNSAGSSTALLMVDTFMTMDHHPQPPPHPVPQQHFSLQGYHEQVPCFSNVLAATTSSKLPQASYLQSLPAFPGMRSFTQLVSLPDLGQFLSSIDNKPPVTSALFASPQQLGKAADRDAGPREDRLPAVDQGAGVQPMWS